MHRRLSHCWDKKKIFRFPCTDSVFILWSTNHLHLSIPCLPPLDRKLFCMWVFISYYDKFNEPVIYFLICFLSLMLLLVPAGADFIDLSQGPSWRLPLRFIMSWSCVLLRGCFFHQCKSLIGSKTPKDLWWYIKNQAVGYQLCKHLMTWIYMIKFYLKYVSMCRCSHLWI